MARRDLGRWHHGQSNALECQDELCEFAQAPLTDAQAIRLARKHIAETAHTVEQEQTKFRYIRPLVSDV